jgi:hypothetical protein
MILRAFNDDVLTLDVDILSGGHGVFEGIVLSFIWKTEKSHI